MVTLGKRKLTPHCLARITTPSLKEGKEEDDEDEDEDEEEEEKRSLIEDLECHTYSLSRA